MAVSSRYGCESVSWHDSCHATSCRSRAIPRPILIPYLSELAYWVRIGYNQLEMLINRMFSRSGLAMELVVGPVTIGVAKATLSMFANTPDTKTDRLHGGPFRLITAAIV